MELCIISEHIVVISFLEDSLALCTLYSPIGFAAASLEASYHMAKMLLFLGLGIDYSIFYLNDHMHVIGHDAETDYLDHGIDLGYLLDFLAGYDFS